ncbi:hypothetical protein [Roseibacillus ishigakijimensis]|uniref:Uncharacterized protein n=1 Tax=Roseibacillus ishigakijimensis TaxID=454146 RepID=A0A934VLB0_9BACT|nr:hypothetical protein [Roseibacillus ishigakijimensis]MBK1833042.1 hypothetical protein [Roseibacillus ishigakijimensis]
MIDLCAGTCQRALMLKLLVAAVAASLLLSSCALLSNALKVPGRTVQSVGRTFGF